MMMSAQLVSMIVMFISGIAVGAVIDCTRTILNKIPLKIVRRFIVLLEWLVWLFLGISTFYLLFLIKGGQWRFVDPLAQIAGIVAYEFAFQKIARFLGRVFVNIFIKPFFYIGHLFVRIVRGIVRIVVGLIIMIGNPFYKFFKKYLSKAFKTNN